jgi:hypothetical protein
MLHYGLHPVKMILSRVIYLQSCSLFLNTVPGIKLEVSQLIPFRNPETGPPVVALVLICDSDGGDQSPGLGVLLNGGELGGLVGEVAEQNLRRMVVGVQQQHLHGGLGLLRMSECYYGGLGLLRISEC